MPQIFFRKLQSNSHMDIDIIVRTSTIIMRMT